MTRGRIILMVLGILLILGVCLAVIVRSSDTAAPTLQQLGEPLRRWVIASKTFEGNGSSEVRSRVAIVVPKSAVAETIQPTEAVRRLLALAEYRFTSQGGAIRSSGVCVDVDTVASYRKFPARLPAEVEFVEMHGSSRSVVITMLYC